MLKAHAKRAEDVIQSYELWLNDPKRTVADARMLLKDLIAIEIWKAERRAIRRERRAR